MRVVKLEKEDVWGSCGAFAMSQPLIDTSGYDVSNCDLNAY